MRGNGEGVTAWSGSGAGGNTVANGWRLRPFHPRFSGYTRIKDAIHAQLKADNLPPQQTASSIVPAPVFPCSDPSKAGNDECFVFCLGSSGVCVDNLGGSR